MTLLTFDGVSCASPDGTVLFSDLTFSLNRETVGLVGRNGCGKSTLLNVAAGSIQPAAGTVARGAKVGFLRQLPEDPQANLAAALGVKEDLARLDRIEAGLPLDDDLDLADWTLPSRLEQILFQTGIPNLSLGRPISSLSGGERTRVMLAAMLIPEPEVLLLDEPTNNLDTAGRAAIADLLESWPGGALVASHDRQLLSKVDRIVELTPTGVHVIGGGWDLFEERRTAERERASQALERSEASLASARREKQQGMERQARRSSAGKDRAKRGGEPRIMLGGQKRRAENTTGRYQRLGSELVDHAEAQLSEARSQVEIVTPIRIDLPPCRLAAGHVLLRAENLGFQRGARTIFSGLELTIRGSERFSITGPNGSGKTTLLAILTGNEAPSEGTIHADLGRIALLDQHLGLLDGAATLDAEMRRHNPGLTVQQARTALAAFGFRNKWADRTVASLSGGERVRLALACLFAGDRPPQLLVLDEPTNHLDIHATELLEQALADWDGAVLCVSHDTAFLEAIGITREIVLG